MIPAVPSDPLQAFCTVIQSEMGMGPDQVYLWNQKFRIPPDERLYIAVREARSKPYGFSNQTVAVDTDEGGMVEEQTVYVQSALSIDIFSRTIEAQQRKNEVILALTSNYSRQVQEISGLLIGKLSTAFNDLSQLEGAAIPYRFQIEVQIQYQTSKSKPIPYYDDFSDAEVLTNA